LTQALALVAGSNGVVGYRMARYLDLHGWRVAGLSRSAPPRGARFRHIAVDLTRADDCRDKLGGVKATHIFYAARFDHAATLAEPIDTNLAMLENLVAAVENKGHRLRHIHLVHGTKYYGAPYGPYKTPARESDPRCLIDNFYYAQQDFIVAWQKRKPWTWSISRPQAVSDELPHVSRSLPWGIAVYATLCKAQGMPLSFPGSAGGYSAIYQCTEAEHLARSAAWMATEQTCANQAFNVTNGDYFRWENLWPAIARYFGMPVGPLRQTKLATAMPGRDACWRALVERHGLRRKSYAGLVDWGYLDFALAPAYDRMSDLTKLRRYGFHEVVDTEEMFLRFFDSYRRRKLIPA